MASGEKHLNTSTEWRLQLQKSEISYIIFWYTNQVSYQFQSPMTPYGLYFICHTVVINQWEISNSLYILAKANKLTKNVLKENILIVIVSKLRGNTRNQDIRAVPSHRLMLRPWTSHWIALSFRMSPSVKYFQRFHKMLVMIILRWYRTNRVYYQYYLHTLLALGLTEPWYTMHWEMHSSTLPQRVYSLTRMERKEEKQETHIPPTAIIPHVGNWEKLCKCHGIASEMCERSIDWASLDEVPVQCFSLYFIKTQLPYSLGS